MVKNILDTIGNTPLVEIKKLSPKKGVKIFAKLEGLGIQSDRFNKRQNCSFYDKKG